MFGNLQRRLGRFPLAQGFSEDQGFFCGAQVLQAVVYRLLHAPQMHQHDHITLGLPLGFGQVEVLLGASLALQHVEPGDGQFIRIGWRLVLPGALVSDLTLQDPHQRRIIPALFGCGHGCLKGLVDAVVVHFVLPRGEFQRPGLALPGSQVGSQHGLGPYCP
jgi:hypothetical protein